ncbi:uncharacterized protein LDX57_007158 [Aspergillus melleus]|uniref:uncharacterized protein n=1 Tax=Aspergillus melleus TaxID=138277 RepID=UPI001E8E4A35|nr:uncharacterized protein LDX57_007158 [Aspergillus melleus]KAH8429496.1 hypothetical protein LDX57_007158 [Aspergillus melleus]
MAYISIAIVGAGPRGTSCLERLCASAETILEAGGKLTIHIIDPYPPGPGKVWRTDQPPRLLMNTIASQVSLFTDETVKCEGPIRPGPTLHEWAAGECWLNWGPNDYPTRFANGRYLEWVFGEICRRAARVTGVNITILKHSASATKLEDDPHDGRQTLTLNTGKYLAGLSAVILAQGHLPARLEDEETYLANFATANKVRGLRYMPPNNPVDSHLDDIAPGEAVLLRGLGLDFFDYLILLTSRRGGRFKPEISGFTYCPSGNEPKIYAGSRRGIPYHARGDNKKVQSTRHQPEFLTESVIEDFRNRDRNDLPKFNEEIWPLVSREVKAVYYRTLLTSRGLIETEKLTDFIRNSLSHEDDNPEEIEKLEDLGVRRDDVWSWERLKKPQGDRTFNTWEEWHQWVLGYLQKDVDYAKAGNVQGPLKAALDVLRDIRNEVRLIVDHHGVDGSSYRDDLVMRYTPLNSFFSVGPPRRRVEEMIALMKAGVLQVLGPDLKVRCHGNDWFAESENPKCCQKVQTVIEARLPLPNLRKTEDPLLKNLLQAGQCQLHKIDGYETGAIDITNRPYHIKDVTGKGHPRRFAIGVPTEGVHWVTTAGVRPCVNSVNLTDTDAVARAALKCADAASTDTAPVDAAPAVAAPTDAASTNAAPAVATPADAASVDAASAVAAPAVAAPAVAAPAVAAPAVAAPAVAASVDAASVDAASAVAAPADAAPVDAAPVDVVSALEAFVDAVSTNAASTDTASVDAVSGVA